MMCSVPFETSITLPPFLPDNETIPEVVWFAIEGAEYGDINSTSTRDMNGTSDLTILLHHTTVDYTVSTLA